MGLLLGVVALLAAAAFGIAGRDQLTLTLDPSSLDSPAEILALLVADVAWLLAATVVLARASTNGAWRPALRRAAIANAVLLAIALVFVAQVEGGIARTPVPSLVPFAAEGDPWTTRLDIPGLRYLLVVLLALALVAALGGVVLVAGTFIATRVRFSRGRTVRERAFGRGQRRAADPEAVLDAIVGARRALRSDDDARRAVVGAYAAMERAVEARGAERRASQTPAEFLHSALDSGLLRDRDAAGRLLRLFELARFSHAELPSDSTELADADLGRLQADLEQVTR